MSRSRTASMLVAGLLVLSFGAATASGSYRHYRALHDRLQLAEAAVQGRDAALAALRGKLEAQRGVVGALRADTDNVRAQRCPASPSLVLRDPT